MEGEVNLGIGFEKAGDVLSIKVHFIPMFTCEVLLPVPTPCAGVPLRWARGCFATKVSRWGGYREP